MQCTLHEADNREPALFLSSPHTQQSTMGPSSADHLLPWMHSGITSHEGANLFQVFIGEYKANVTLDVWDEALELRELTKEGAEGMADHHVLTHQHNSLATKCNTDLVHLVGTDIVNIDKENGFYGAKSKVCFQYNESLNNHLPTVTKSASWCIHLSQCGSWPLQSRTKASQAFSPSTSCLYQMAQQTRMMQSAYFHLKVHFLTTE